MLRISPDCFSCEYFQIALFRAISEGYILMSHNMKILYFHLPFFHVPNSVLFLHSTSVLSCHIDIVLKLSNGLTWPLSNKIWYPNLSNIISPNVEYPFNNELCWPFIPILDQSALLCEYGMHLCHLDPSLNVTSRLQSQVLHMIKYAAWLFKQYLTLRYLHYC